MLDSIMSLTRDAGSYGQFSPWFSHSSGGVGSGGGEIIDA